MIEGFKSEDFPKIEVWRAESGTLPRMGKDHSIVAIATPDQTLKAPVPVLDLNNESSIADFIIQYFNLETIHETTG